jgi:hypothetical protein
MAMALVGFSFLEEKIMNERFWGKGCSGGKGGKGGKGKGGKK